MIAAAIESALGGWPVVPCREVNTLRPPADNSKAPYKDADLGLEHGHLDATTDLAKIIKWWTRWPNALIGARVPDSLIVIDGDPRNNSNWLNELISLVGPLPKTLTAWSGRNDGGRHFYFLRPFGETTSMGLPKGVDLKRRGYCIIPPSIHPATGEPYRWEYHPVATMPYALRELLRPAPRVPRMRDPFAQSSSKNGKPLVDFVAGFVTDGVNNALYWAACRAAEDGLLDQIDQELIATAVSVGESERQAERTVKSARQKILGGAA
jgi:hypothetical protein